MPVQRLRDQLKQVTADAILTAAESVFAAQGLHATRMEEIATRAGVAIGTLYNHFADRKALLDALTRSRRESLLREVDLAMDTGKGKPFAEQLESFVRALLEHFASHSAFLNAVMHSGEPKPLTLITELEARARKLMQRGVAQKALSPHHADLYAPAFVGIIRGVIGKDIAEGSVLVGRVAPIVKLFLQGAGAS